MMAEEITMIGKIIAKPQLEKSLQQLLLKLCQETLLEKGCLFYQVHRDSQNPSHFILWKKFTSQQALESYFGSITYQRHFGKIHEFALKPVEFTYLEEIKD